VENEKIIKFIETNSITQIICSFLNKQYKNLLRLIIYRYGNIFSRIKKLKLKMQNFFSNWIQKLFNCFYEEDTISFVNLLDPKSDKEKFELTFRNIIEANDISPIITDNLRLQLKDEKKLKNWSDFITNFFLYRINNFRENYITAFEYLKDSFIVFQEIYKMLETPKFLNTILKLYMRHLLFISMLADDSSLKQKKNSTNIQCVNELGRHLMNFFSKFQNCEEKEIIFFAIICIIRIHFKLRTYRNSNTLVEWINLGHIDLNLMPKSDLVTYYYYSGRLALYELKISEARKIFANAFDICTFEHRTNLKLILEYLIPLNLFFGKIPNFETLKNYDLVTYWDLIEAYKSGDLKKFEEALEKLEDRLIMLGTFLIVDKLRGYVVRNLIKTIYKIFEEELNQMKFSVISIELVSNVLKNVFGYENYDLDELELYLNSVIYKGLIAGYIHNKDKVIVFSKKNPFPSLGEVLGKYYDRII